jgi:hypothetical protein
MVEGFIVSEHLLTRVERCTPVRSTHRYKTVDKRTYTIKIIDEISGPHGSEYEDDSFLGCCTA